MTAIYPTDYPFYYNSEGWPEPVYAPPYPFEYYYDNGQNAPPIRTTSEFRNNYYPEYPSDAYYKLPLTIRRHRPETTGLLLRPLVTKSPLPRITPRYTVNRTRSHTNNQRSVSVDPDDRPIRPMADTSIYREQSGSKKPSQSKKPPPPKKPPLRFLEPIRIPSRYGSDSSQPPSSRRRKNRPPISHTPSSTITERRPIRTDLISRTPIGATPRRTQPRRIVVEEYADEDYYPVTYIKPLPRKVVSYRRPPRSTLQEYDDYEIPKVRRVVRVRSPPTETIIYQT